jgi:hypothetical protein
MSVFYIGGGHPFQIAYVHVDKGGADLEGTLILAAYLGHGQQFINGVISGDKWMCVLLKLCARGGMIAVGRHEPAKPSAGIDEDRSHCPYSIRS